MTKQLLGNKQIPITIRRRLYQATVVNIVLWGCESLALREANRSKLGAFHPVIVEYDLFRRHRERTGDTVTGTMLVNAAAANASAVSAS
jgi:hypothetical protein